jgi:hypothetical protein
MIGLFVILMVMGAMLVGGVAIAASIVLRLFLGLVLLPFRLFGFILFLPFLLLRVVIGGLFGLVLAPVFIVGVPLVLVGGIIAIVLFSLLTPLLPLIAIGAFIWLLVRASSRPRADLIPR